MTGFHHIRLELAREAGHPGGDSGDGWDLVAALDDQGLLDLEACRADPERCFVRRFMEHETVATGHLRHGLGNRWLLDLDGRDDLDATGFRFGEERFVLGEYVSIVSSNGKTHTYCVKQLGPVDVDAEVGQAMR